MIITIDGPTASGKSTVARAVALKLEIYYIYSGLLFRALAYLLIKNKGYSVQSLASPLFADVQEIFDPMHFEYQYHQGKEQIIFDRINITDHLKHSDIDRGASIISTNSFVRDALLTLQRDIARTQSVVVDGRDTGSVVFPHAQYKFFITASLKERARRWRLDQAKRGMMFTDDQACAAIAERDERDSSRALAPLTIPDGAVVIDSTDLSKDAVIALILKCVNSTLE